MTADGPIFCTNTTYFLTLRQWQREQLRPRRVLVVDEAHNLEAQLVRVFTVAFAPDQMKEWFGGPLRRLGSAEEYRILFEDHGSRLDTELALIDDRLASLRPPGLVDGDFLLTPQELALLGQRDLLESARRACTSSSMWKTRSGWCATRPRSAPRWSWCRSRSARWRPRSLRFATQRLVLVEHGFGRDGARVCPSSRRSGARGRTSAWPAPPGMRAVVADRRGGRDSGLTPREAEVVGWVGRGKTNADIGTILGISDKTVDKHLQHVFVKLGVETRTEPAAVALERLQCEPSG